MLFIESIIPNIDNSGFITGKIIHNYNSNNKKTSTKIKQWVLVASQKLKFTKFNKKRLTTKAIIVKTKKNIRRKNGHYLKFSKNGLLVFYENTTLKGTRFKGPVAAELKFQPLKEIILKTKAMI